MKQLTIQSIGTEALAVIRNGGAARVIGSTSKGIFAITEAKAVIFLSYERYHSPLTVNLGLEDEDLRQVEIGDEIRFDPFNLRIEFEKVLLDCSGVLPWLASSPVGEVSSPIPRKERVKAVAAGIAAHRPEIGFSPLVSALILNKKDGQTILENPEIGLRIERICRSSLSRDPRVLLHEMNGLLGFGRGLTPSGDDFVIGFLLAANRWEEALGWYQKGLGAFNDAMVKMAEAKTTSLSAAMIRLAARGEGDERQLAVVDGLMCGEPVVEICLQNVLEMGNSSGIDSFLGMAAGIL